MADNTVRGRFVWHELYTPNVAGAHEFYSKTAGWKTQGWEQDPSYRMFAAPTGPLGATQSRTGVPQWWHIGATDVDAQSRQRLGARSRGAADAANAGRYAVLADRAARRSGALARRAPPETDPSTANSAAGLRRRSDPSRRLASTRSCSAGTSLANTLG
jgi:predicted enzyme related to lactoylglutathione lyase